MKLKYFTVERSDKNIKDVLSKLRRELGVSRLHAYVPLVALGGNTRILELKKSITSELVIKVDGPEFIMKELYDYFVDGGNI